mgnify:FL=1
MAIESYVHNGPAGVRLRPHHWRVSGVFMECTLVVPHGTDISIIEREYPDLCNDEISEDGDVYLKDAGDRAERERCSKLWHEAFERGKLSR